VARVQLAKGDLSDPKDGRREAIVLKVQNNPQGLDKVFAQEGPKGRTRYNRNFQNQGSRLDADRKRIPSVRFESPPISKSKELGFWLPRG
jgi:hypothetical protein